MITFFVLFRVLGLEFIAKTFSLSKYLFEIYWRNGFSPWNTPFPCYLVPLFQLKTSPRAKPHKWKWVWLALKCTCRGNTVSYEWLRTKTRLLLTQTIKVAPKWTIIQGRRMTVTRVEVMTQLHTWFPWLWGVATKDVFSAFDQHKSRTFVITPKVKISRPATISWSSVQQRTCRIRRQPWLKSW